MKTSLRRYRLLISTPLQCSNAPSCQFKINTLGVIHSIKAFLPLLKASTAPLKKVAVINSAAADPKWSLAADSATEAAYAITKAASIVAATKWAVMVKKDNIVVVSFHPGLVDTWETRGESGTTILVTSH